MHNKKLPGKGQINIVPVICLTAAAVFDSIIFEQFPYYV
jgi:hypothetical protein